MKSREFSPKEKAIYQAVIELFREGADLNNLTVAEITGKAGIGKGTAYEYFTDKEEMIAKAVFYHTEEFCDELYLQVEKEAALPDKIDLVLRRLEEEVTETNCIFRLIHAMTDNSMLGRKMKEIEETDTPYGMLAGEIINRIILDEKGNDGISQEKKEYLMLSLFSGILCYGMYLQKNKNAPAEKRIAMRKQVCSGICREIMEE